MKVRSNTKTLPTIIYVEDDEEWRLSVEKYIKIFSRVEFADFICGSTIEEMEAEFRTAGAPVVLIFDLRLGGEETPNYEGYHWLLEELEDFLRRNPYTLVFVISGQLHAGIKETLQRLGIPDNHIYDKGDWAEQRAEFAHVLREDLAKLEKSSLLEAVGNIAGRNIDPYLTHTLRLSGVNLEDSTARQIVRGSPNRDLLPMLVRTRNVSWEISHVPELKIFGRIGDILYGVGSEQTLAFLERDASVLDVEASRPGLEPEGPMLVPVGEARTAHQNRSERGGAAVIGLVDDGIDVLHESFLDDAGARTRIVAIWDQTDPTGPHPTAGGFGTVYTEEQINTFLAAGKAPERLVGDGHGTHMASIAGGRKIGDFAGGMAPEAKLILVIPALEASKQEGPGLGYSVSHLAALAFIRDVARQLSMPVVIQVCQGLTIGPHDGTSVLEQGFDAVIGQGREPGIVIVKSAGNGRGKCGHAKIDLTGLKTESLRWKVRTSQAVCVLELWVQADDRFTFRLKNPAGETSESVHWLKKNRHGFFDEGGNSYFITYTRYDRSNGDSRVLVSIHAGSADVVTPGEWTLEIEAAANVRRGKIDAWLERRHGVWPVFLSHVSDEATLTVPATARHVISVGSVGTATPLHESSFTSMGPTRDGRRKPDVWAPGEAIVAAASGSARGVIGRDGTSAAAAHVTGAVCLVLSAREKMRRRTPNLHQLTADEVRDGLSRTAHRLDYAQCPGMNGGVLDADGLLAFFDQPTTGERSG